MASTKVYSIESVSLSVTAANPPALTITVKGENLNSNYSGIKLDPFVYVQPPPNGIWEFNMIGEVPPITDNIITHVSAQLEWQAPAGAKGVKVYGQMNSKTATVRKSGGSTGSTTGIQVISAKAVIDTRLIGPTAGSTLNVSLTYNSNNHGFHNLRMASPQGINPSILLLELTNEPEDIYIFNPRSSAYSKELAPGDQYTSVEILYEGNPIATIDNISRLI